MLYTFADVVNDTSDTSWYRYRIRTLESLIRARINRRDISYAVEFAQKADESCHPCPLRQTIDYEYAEADN